MKRGEKLKPVRAVAACLLMTVKCWRPGTIAVLSGLKRNYMISVFFAEFFAFVCLHPAFTSASAAILSSYNI